MHKVRLVIADTDENYLQQLSDYARTAHKHRLLVSSFTAKESLLNYLASGEKVDALLISSEFDGAEVRNTGILVALLSSGAAGSAGDQDGIAIYKYQPGDRIIRRLLEHLVESDAEAMSVLQGSSVTRLVTVCSPCGGAGKTTVAVNLAVQAALAGQKVFYLNLETISSTPLFLHGEGAKCFSHVLLYLDDPLLPARVDGARVTDSRYQVDFFQPPESGIELTVLDQRGMAALLSAFKQLSIYDLVVIDTDTVLNDRLSVLVEAADRTVLVLTPEIVCDRKRSLLSAELSRLNWGRETPIINVVNQLRPGDQVAVELRDSVFIPVVANPVISSSRSSGLLEFNDLFAVHMSALVQQVI